MTCFLCYLKGLFCYLYQLYYIKNKFNFQGSIYEWVRYHRLHHAHFETDGDPYDHNKGFLYAHFIARFRLLSEYQTKLLEKIDMTDLENDGIVMFQKK